MINTSSMPGPTQVPTERPTLVDHLARKADVNRDGTVTTAEFTAFLTRLMPEPGRDAAASEPVPSTERGGSEVVQADPVVRIAAQPATAIDALQKAIRRTGGGD